jgi:hypothetical protein
MAPARPSGVQLRGHARRTADPCGGWDPWSRTRYTRDVRAVCRVRSELAILTITIHAPVTAQCTPPPYPHASPASAARTRPDHCQH